MVLTAALLLATATAGAPPLPAVRDGAPGPVRGIRTRTFDAARFNADGNVLIGWTDAPGGVDVLTEFTAAGATVWECRMTPAGALDAFARGTDGLTRVTRRGASRTRVLVLARGGDVRAGGFDLVPPHGAEPVRVTALGVLPDGAVVLSVPGWAFERDRKGRIRRQVLHQALRSAAPLADGRWLAVLTDPYRFAVYDHATRALQPLPIDALCQIWDAVRAEEVGPRRWRLTGCFCVPQEAPPGKPIPRKTMEFVDIDPGGGYLWAYGGPQALRVEEFGEQRCATFSRAVVDLPDGRLLVLNGAPDACAAVELDPAGLLIRPWLSAPPTGTGNPGTFGEHACGLIGATRLGWTRSTTGPTMTP